MGVWQRSPDLPPHEPRKSRKCRAVHLALPGWKPEDVIGSPYAVAAYVPDPRIGNWEALDAAREKLHARGMALFLDFVANHTALDHPWMREHPEFYVQAPQQEFQKNPSLFYPIHAARSAIHRPGQRSLLPSLDRT